ncbi:MAG: hypothetical protein ACRBCL_08180 [Maritimibacter sp.]
MALTCRAYKDAGQKGIHVDLAGLLGLFGDNTALLRSDGAVLALTRNGLVGVSDFPEYGDDIDGWVSVASGVFANRARFLNQAELSQALMEET